MERRQDNAELPVNGNQLARWIIKKAAESEAYRAGMLTGMKHPKPDREMIKASGGLPELIRQADELEQNGYIQTEKSNLGADMKKIRIPSISFRSSVKKRGLKILENNSFDILNK